MARCSSCSAPLPTHSQHCRYCGVRNDMDLHAHQVERLGSNDESLQCPECAIALDRLSVAIGAGLEVGHCSSCFGMFFAPGGVEYALNEGVSHAEQLRIKQIDQVNIDRFSKASIRYRNCPVCDAPMRRFNFAKRSGVIVDQCARHGVWLDNGELIHLLEWRKSGGHLIEGNSTRVGLDPMRAVEVVEAKARAERTLGQYPVRRGSVLNTDLEDLLYSAVDLLTGFWKK